MVIFILTVQYSSPLSSFSSLFSRNWFIFVADYALGSFVLYIHGIDFIFVADYTLGWFVLYFHGIGFVFVADYTLGWFVL